MYGFTIAVEGNAVSQMKTIEAELEKMGVKARVEANHVKSSFEGIGHAIGEIKGLIGGALLAGGIFGGFEFIKGSIEAYDKMEAAVTRVNTVIESTKGAAGISGEAIESSAKSLSKSIIQGRAEIMDAQGMLLSFTGIKSNIFGDVTKSVADFATFYKTDMTSAALQIGKAMNNPLTGMNRLQRMGVAFTDSQKEQIKNYMEQGNLLKAQQVILKELQTEFGGQAAAAALTDEGKITMATKQWGSLKLQLGEVFSKIQVSLIPAFTSVVKYIKDAFTSEPVLFFLEHIKDLVAVVLKLIPIWLGYKAVMMGVAAVTSLVAIKDGILTLSMGELTVMTNGATVATEGFTAALASTGIGALVIGIGLVIEKFIEWNSKINDTVEGLSHIKEISATGKGLNDKFEKVQTTFHEFNSLSDTMKSETVSDMKALAKEAQEEIERTARPALNKAKAELAVLEERSKRQSLNSITGKSAYDPTIETTRSRLAEAVQKSAENLQRLYLISNSLSKELKFDVVKNVKELKPTKFNEGVKDNAINTSALSGAKGGLGEAKVINIRIDTMQKVEVKDGNGLKEKSQDAIEILTRTLNNLAYSQGSSM